MVKSGVVMITLFPTTDLLSVRNDSPELGTELNRQVLEDGLRVRYPAATIPVSGDAVESADGSGIGRQN